MVTVPDDWPAGHRPALAALLNSADDPRRFLIMTVVKKYLGWIREAGDKPALAVAPLRRFQAHLRASLSDRAAGAQMRILYDIGVRGPDANVRDWLYENFYDARRPEDIVRGRWWPPHLAPMAAGLSKTFDRRILQELDNFFRFKERAGGHLAIIPLNGLFLREGLSPRTRYQRLARLCGGLEHLDAGSADLVTLRAMLPVLHRQASPGSGAPRRSAARRIPEVEAMLAAHQRGRVNPWRPDTVEGRRRVLNTYFDILRAANYPFGFDKRALDLFADHVFKKVEEKNNPLVKGGWRLSSAITKVSHLAPFIPGVDLRREWRSFEGDLRTIARKRGDLKVKALKLAQRPWSLDNFYRRATALLDKADNETRVQERWATLVVVGMLGLLLFFPLRRADLRRLVLGREIVRTPVGWELLVLRTQKKNTPVEALRLPAEATPFLDAVLRQGAAPERLWEVYKERLGRPIFESRLTRDAYEVGSLTHLFSARVGHSPHILRTVWHDELVAQGADRLVIQHMLQHGSVRSQKEYDIVAGKIRRLAALRAVRDLADRATAA